jgi:hypothetical protein
VFTDTNFTPLSGITINKVTDTVEITNIPYCIDIIVDCLSSNFNGKYSWNDYDYDAHVNRIWWHSDSPATIELMEDNDGKSIYYVLYDINGPIVRSELISSGYPPYNTNGTSLKWYDSTNSLVPDMTVIPKFDIPSTIIKNKINWSRKQMEFNNVRRL